MRLNMRNILFLWLIIFSTSCLAEFNELVVASQNGDVGKIKQLLKKGYDPNCCADYEPLAAASLMGHTEIVELLIDNGAIIKDLYVISAIVNGRIDLVKLFIAKGAKLPVFEPETSKPVLYYPASQANLEMVKLLVEHGYKPTEQDNQGTSVVIKTEKYLNKLETVLEYLKSKS
jgi:ankyrin repeat protein